MKLLLYQALAVIEYLVAHGSERAVDDIIEHTFQISVRTFRFCIAHAILKIMYNEIESLTFSLVVFIKSLSSFEYVEPNGKDMGINVRKKAESIVALLNNKEKIQEVRNKAAANRDK